LSVDLSVCNVYYDKMAEWIRMLIGMVSGVSRGKDILDGSGDHRRGRAVFGMNLGHTIVTNGDFATRLFTNYLEQSCIGIERRANNLQYHIDFIIEGYCIPVR